jgi:hypothetical protein
MMRRWQILVKTALNQERAARISVIGFAFCCQLSILLRIFLDLDQDLIINGEVYEGGLYGLKYVISEKIK